jgi:hypothetical protein
MEASNTNMKIDSLAEYLVLHPWGLASKPDSTRAGSIADKADGATLKASLG